MDRAGHHYSSEKNEVPAEATRRRVATIYDAVAGRVQKNKSLRGFDSVFPDDENPRECNAGSTTYTPDEVLFRRQDAPQRYAEHDIYYANERDFPDAGDGTLPDSDLLKSIHHYASHYYASTRKQGRAAAAARDAGDMRRLMVDERSLDETALLAFGILMEEAGRGVLGKDGALVFTEGAEMEEDEEEAVVDEEEGERRETRSETGGEDMEVDVPAPPSKRRRKKESSAKG